MAEAEDNGAAAEDQAAPDLATKVEDWFFNFFHQPVVLNNPDVFAQATAAKSELLKLLGL